MLLPQWSRYLLFLWELLAFIKSFWDLLFIQFLACCSDGTSEREEEEETKFINSSAAQKVSWPRGFLEPSFYRLFKLILTVFFSSHWSLD